MHEKNTIEILSELVAIESISSDQGHQEDVMKSAQYVEKLFLELGLETKIATSGNSRPAVLAQTAIDPQKKTVLLYAHHDVQPVGDIDKWKTEPFTPQIIDGRLYGRGSGDNKAGVVTHYEVVKALKDNLPVNIKVFIEGEEEIGSPCMAEFLDEYQDDLEADVIIIADSGNIKIGTPTVTTSLRGLVDGVIVVEQPMRAVHSGLGGGVVPDAFMVLSKIIASFHNEKGELQIEGLTSSDMEVLELEEKDIKEIFGSKDINLFELDSISKRLWLEPALSILAIDAPSTDEAVNLLIPNAKAKVSLRLPPTENPEHAMKMLEEHIMKNIPWGAKVSFEPEAMGSGIVADPNKEFTKTLVKNFEEVWDNNAAYMGVGGSIPFANDFVEKFPNAELVLVGAGDEEMGNAHAPNESVQIEDIENLIKSLIKTLKDFS
ncbi:M20/M25/M40 family metallo-hydrolase, partial [Acidimicrobiia bacterium]|nr:M20/M25/M40 family metallo-hydrolase [Acidimicrobiia bacterium]MDC0596037.1 M20/M25/M40 family metallo-hydrolase [Acidimicrobiia bacterium]MDC3404269.1 M20/M25/M40 family metallo-hydrolase [Acidimicrobiia bacterium]